MQLAQQPPKIPSIFASAAPFANVTNPIPNTAQTGGFVSWPTGFQDINFTQQAAGGIPPWGRDFNGLFQTFSAWIQWFQAGGAPPKFDQQFANEIGGYPQGAFLSNAVTLGSFWINQTDNNISNPDSGGANWLAFPPAFQIPPAPPPIEIFPELPPPPPPTILPPQETLINNVTLQNFLTVQNFTQPSASNGRLMNIRVYNVPGNFYYLPSNAPCSGVEIVLQGGGGAGGGASADGGCYCSAPGGPAGGIAVWYGPTAYVAGQLIEVGSGGLGYPASDGGSGTQSAVPAIGLIGMGGPGTNRGQNLQFSQHTFTAGNGGATGYGGNILNLDGLWGGMSHGGPSAPDGAGFVSGFGGGNFFGGGSGHGNGQIGPGGHYGNGPNGPGGNGQMGGGGGGATSFNGGGNYAGGNGGNGFIIIKEYS